MKGSTADERHVLPSITSWFEGDELDHPAQGYMMVLEKVLRARELYNLCTLLQPVSTVATLPDRFAPVWRQLKNMSTMQAPHSSTIAGIAYLTTSIRDLQHPDWPWMTHMGAAHGFLRIAVSDFGYRFGGDRQAREDLLESDVDWFLFLKSYDDLRETLSDMLLAA
ncbi:hypothetical protein AB0M12_40230 [Nocardia vinacea]|uniref:hypothetical protein n=1 Tax=Nocardia vinacea TaxID=96468 RepID=UPI003436E79A